MLQYTLDHFPTSTILEYCWHDQWASSARSAEPRGSWYSLYL